MATDWDDGRLLEIKSGETATTKNLNKDQLYAFIFHNPGADDVKVDVGGTGGSPVVHADVPGTGKQYPPLAVVFLHSGDAQSVSVTVPKEQESEPGEANTVLSAMVFSVAMPLNTTGIANEPVNDNGEPSFFGERTRLFVTPSSTRYRATVESNSNPFAFIRMRQRHAVVHVLNETSQYNVRVYGAGRATDMFSVVSAGSPMVEHLLGRGDQYVWSNLTGVGSTPAGNSSLSLSPVR